MNYITVPAEHYAATVKAMTGLVHRNDELQQQIADYEDAFEQFSRDAYNAENAEYWLNAQKQEGRDTTVEQPIDKPLSYYEQQVIHHQLQLDEAMRIVRNLKTTTTTPGAHISDNETGSALEQLIDTELPIPYTITETAPNFSAAPNPRSYSLSEASAILRQKGVDTGQNKLRKYLNEGICWTDGYGSPREGVADQYLIETEPPNPSRGAVVRVTTKGLDQLIATMPVVK